MAWIKKAFKKTSKHLHAFMVFLEMLVGLDHPFKVAKQAAT